MAAARTNKPDQADAGAAPESTAGVNRPTLKIDAELEATHDQEEGKGATQADPLHSLFQELRRISEGGGMEPAYTLVEECMRRERDAALKFVARMQRARMAMDQIANKAHELSSRQQ